MIATDMKPEAMKRAEENGAVSVPGGAGQVEAIRELTRGRGVDAAFVGIGGGVVEWSFFTTPYESTITNTYWGTIEDLYDVVAMYRGGQIRPDIERFAMEDALDGYRRLESGQLSGRAVVTPHG